MKNVYLCTCLYCCYLYLHNNLSDKFDNKIALDGVFEFAANSFKIKRKQLDKGVRGD